jgi:hypothetical protein
LPEGAATVGETTAPGYTFQGKLVRPALVILATPKVEAAPMAELPTEAVTETVAPAEVAAVETEREPRLL